MPPNHAAHGEDLYALLQIPKTASEAEIKKAYRKLALCYHPDRQTTDEDRQDAQQKFAKLSAAYEILSDPLERKHYDDNEAKSLAANKPVRAAPSQLSKSQDWTNVMPKSTSNSTKKQTATKPTPSVGPKKSPSSKGNQAVSKSVPVAKSSSGNKSSTSSKPAGKCTNTKSTTTETSKSTVKPPRPNSTQPSSFSWSRHLPNKTPRTVSKAANPQKKHAPKSTSSSTPHSSSKPTERELKASKGKSDKKSITANHSNKGSQEGNAKIGSFFSIFASKKG